MIPDANLALPGKRWPVGPIAKVLALVLAAIGWVQVNMGAALYAARDVDTVGILRAGGAAAAGAALLALLYWKIRHDPKKKKIFLGAIAAVVVLAIPVGLYKLTTCGALNAGTAGWLHSGKRRFHLHLFRRVYLPQPAQHGQTAAALFQCAGGAVGAGRAGHCPGRTHCVYRGCQLGAGGWLYPGFAGRGAAAGG